MNHNLHLHYAKKLVEKYQDTFDKDIALGHAQNLMRNHVQSLIHQSEKLQKIINSWIAIEEQGSVEDAENFYTIVQDILAGDSNE